MRRKQIICCISINTINYCVQNTRNLKGVWLSGLMLVHHDEGMNCNEADQYNEFCVSATIRYELSGDVAREFEVVPILGRFTFKVCLISGVRVEFRK